VPNLKHSVDRLNHAYFVVTVLEDFLENASLGGGGGMALHDLIGPFHSATSATDTYFLRGDMTWALPAGGALTPHDLTGLYHTMSGLGLTDFLHSSGASAVQFAPIAATDLGVSPTASKYLRGDMSWVAVPAVTHRFEGATIYHTVTGLGPIDVLHSSGASSFHFTPLVATDLGATPDASKYLQGDMTWALAPNATHALSGPYHTIAPTATYSVLTNYNATETTLVLIPTWPDLLSTSYYTDPFPFSEQYLQRNEYDRVFWKPVILPQLKWEGRDLTANNGTWTGHNRSHIVSSWFDNDTFVYEISPTSDLEII
jgi:hypothetical protein